MPGSGRSLRYAKLPKRFVCGLVPSFDAHPLAYRRIGSRVTVVQHGPQLMDRQDPDVSDELQWILSDECIQVLVGAETLHVRARSEEEVRLVVRTSSGGQNIQGSDILVAAGRISEHGRHLA